jgi:hypothetical protein
LDLPKETRLESYEQIAPVAEIRKRLILDILRTRDGLTAQELAVVLHSRGHIPSDERNFTAPRLTELRKDGKVTPVGKKQCAKTGRKVTVWAAVKEGAINAQETQKHNHDPALIAFYKKGIRAGILD